MVRVELGRELRIELGDPGGVFVIPGACMSSGRVVREPRTMSPDARPAAGGPQKRPACGKAGAFARFHTLDEQQNSADRGEGKPPPLINLSTRAKICANFYATDFG